MCRWWEKSKEKRMALQLGEKFDEHTQKYPVIKGSYKYLWVYGYQYSRVSIFTDINTHLRVELVRQQ